MQRDGDRQSRDTGNNRRNNVRQSPGHNDFIDVIPELDTTPPTSDEDALAKADFLRDLAKESTSETKLEEEGPTTIVDLDVSGSGLREVSTQMLRQHWDTIRSIDAYNNKLTGLPPALGRLKALESLDISDNRFAALPTVISNLASLRVLNISQNLLRELEQHVLNLLNLVILDCRNNKIAKIPPGIRKLTFLQELDVSSNALVDLPNEISELGSLLLLDISRNKIKRLPPNIGRLTNLNKLSARGNSLHTLPPGIQFLHKLDELDLSDNEFKILPSQLGNLRDLRMLDLSENAIATIPPEIGKLSKLEQLVLDGNNITTLPEELGNLPDFVDISISDNPLAEPLPALVSRGSQALLTYLRSLGDGEPQYEAKVLLVGEGGVGKSSLVAALRGDSFVHDRPTTHGIEIGKLELDHPDLDVKISLNTWDFGGQEVYRITHQFFFSRRSLYLVVWKPREGQEENNVEAWCRRIRLRVGHHARIIIVATHADERRPELDFATLQSKFPSLVVGYAVVDSESGRGIPYLKELMADQSAGLPQMGEIISQSWANARGDILNNSSSYIFRSTFERVCDRHGIDEDGTETLSALLHDLGHIIHYSDDDGLRDIVVLQPEWITKAIGYVLEDEQTRAHGGVLDHQRLPQIWSTVGKGQQQSIYRYCLRLMEKFDVSYRLPSETQSLVAQLVPYERPRAVWQDRVEKNSPYRTLRIVCQMSEEAVGLIAWLTVRNHRFSTGNHWRRGVLLEHTQHNSFAVFELQSDNRHLKLSVIGPSPDYFFHVLRDGLEDLIRRRWRGLSYELLVPCPSTSNGISCTGAIPLGVIQKFRQRGEKEIACYTCATHIDIHRVLTGFGKLSAPLDKLLDEVRDSYSKISSQIGSVQVAQAQTARRMHMMIKMLSKEVVDCPRLFTVSASDRGTIKSAISLHDELEITLWCEEAGHEHCWIEATYKFRPSKNWVVTVAPYARFVAELLHFVVPIGAAAVGAVVDEESLKRTKGDLDLMKALVDKIPELSIQSQSIDRTGISKAEGSGLRALRSLLYQLDPPARFGGLRRIIDESGDYLWVCPEHYSHYDPGLPSI